MTQSAPGGVRGKPQRRRPPDEPSNPNELVQLGIRIPARLRAKARRNAAAAGLSLAVYIEQLLDQAPALEAPNPLPLAESA